MAAAGRLFKPIQVGKVQLGHRIVLAPLTRVRSDEAHVPVADLMATYYAQRAVSLPQTLLISEATLFNATGNGMSYNPGVFTDAQIAEWRKVTDAVHAVGGHIFVQLWHLGRAASYDVIKKEGLKYKSSSSTRMPGRPESEPLPEELSEDEIQQIIKDWAATAKKAIDLAGFDGIEGHFANGFLADQFLQTITNQRTDRWGGSIENRSRFILEVSKAIINAVGADRFGLRLSPWNEFQGMRMPDPKPQFGHVVEELAKLQPAYLHLVEARSVGFDIRTDLPEGEDNNFAIDAWTKHTNNPIILAGGYTSELARKTVDETYPDKNILIAFGRLYISNPDLPYRLKNELELSPYDRTTFSVPGTPNGYTTYSYSDAFVKEHNGQPPIPIHEPVTA